MLVLKRKLSEQLVIGPHVRIVVVDAGHEWCKLGIDAPKDWPIVRAETEWGREYIERIGAAMKLLEWIRILLSGEPHFYIGGTERPYLLRWFLIPRNRWFNIYLHKFLRDDDDRALHCHPWLFVSVILRGRYIEWTDTGPWIRRVGSIAFRRAVHRHRVELPKREDGTPVPCWTLVITGPRVREWGFWCEKGFVPWHEFVASDDHGNIGRGCG